MLKKLFISLVGSAFLALSFSSAALAADMFVIERDDCKHCQDLREFVNEDEAYFENYEIEFLDLAEEENEDLFADISKAHDLSRVTPTIFVGDTVIQGFADGQTTGELIRQLLERESETSFDSAREYVAYQDLKEIGDYAESVCEDEEACEVDSSILYNFKVPLFGYVNLEKWSLSAMSLTLGFIDGFNPCAMWVLVTFLLVLLQVGDRKKMFQIAGLFIVAEAIMYYLILNVWLGVWDFVGLDEIVTSIVGLVAIGGGLFFLWEWKTSDGTCKVTNLKQRSKTQSKIKKIVSAEMTLLTVIGIIGLALSVNVIEFACSIGIPQAYTKILDINALSFIEKQFQTLLYILMYMVDDVIVFAIALYGADKLHLTTKYSKLCNLIGGVLMLILGALLLLAPELLVL